MENPAYWTDTEKLINKVLDDWHHRDQDIIGFSVIHLMYLALKDAGMLKGEECPYC